MAELAPMRWIHWYYDTQRIHGHPGNIPPPEYEALYVPTGAANNALEINRNGLQQTQGEPMSPP